MAAAGLHWESVVAWMRRGVSPDLHRAKAAVNLNTTTAPDASLEAVKW